LMLVLYAPDFEPVEGSSFSLANAVLALLALVGFTALAFGVSLGRGRDREPESAIWPTPSPASTPA
jgi:hypothetical protein